LPECVETETAWHYWVAFEMAAEEPEIWVDVEFGNDLTFACGAAGVVDFNNTVGHKHIWGWETCIAWAKQFATRAGEDFFTVVRGLGLK
jgi:hypothetical protein